MPYLDRTAPIKCDEMDKYVQQTSVSYIDYEKNYDTWSFKYSTKMKSIKWSRQMVDVTFSRLYVTIYPWNVRYDPLYANNYSMTDIAM